MSLEAGFESKERPFTTSCVPSLLPVCGDVSFLLSAPAATFAACCHASSRGSMLAKSLFHKRRIINILGIYTRYHDLDFYYYL